MLSTRWFTTFFLCLVSLLLVSCSRDNPLSIPAEFVEEEEEICEELSLDIFQLLKEVTIDAGHTQYVYAIDHRDSLEDIQLDYLIDRVIVTASFSSEVEFSRETFSDNVISNAEENIRGLDDFDDRVDEFIRELKGIDEDEEIVFPIEDVVGQVTFFRDRAYFEDLYVDTTVDELISALEVNDLSVALNYEVAPTEVDGTNSQQIELSSGSSSFYIDILSGSGSLFQFDVSGVVRIPALLSLCFSEEDFADSTKSVDLARTYDLQINRKAKTTLSSNQRAIQLADGEGDQFGTDVSISGFNNQNNSGVKLIAVGSPYEDSEWEGAFTASEFSNLEVNNQVSDSGAVYVLIEDLVSNTFITDGFIKASTVDTGDLFGFKVSLDGNLLAVSAPHEDSSGTGVNSRQDDNLAPNSGAIYIFERDTDTSQVDSPYWRQTAYIKPPNNDPGDNGFDDGFGESIILKDGFLFVSAPREDSIDGAGVDLIAPNSGAVYVYKVNEEGEWSYQSAIKAPVVGEGDLFGTGISYYNSELLVGAPNEDSAHNGVDESTDFEDTSHPAYNDGKANSGAAYLYRIDSMGNSVIAAYIKPSASDIDDMFGSSLALDRYLMFIGVPNDDSNGEGFNRNKDNNSLENSGAVYAFGIDPELTFPTLTEFLFIKPPSPQEQAQFGSHLNLDLNDLLVGSPHFDNGQGLSLPSSSLGRTYIYEFGAYSSTDFAFDIELIIENSLSNEDLGATTAFFGRSSDLFDGVVVEGAPGYKSSDPLNTSFTTDVGLVEITQ